MGRAEYIEGWFNDLTTAQPAFGPLRQETTDKVGALLLVNDDGTPATGAYERGVAQGFIRSYADAALNRRIVQADADKSDEALTFWIDVKNWIGL